MSIKEKTFSGISWSMLQQFSTQGINLAISFIMARLLVPEDFGVVGMVYIFISIGILLYEGGLPQSLLRTENPDNSDYSTVFYMNLICSAAIYIVIYAAAPWIASFYEKDILIPVIRLYSIVILLSAFSGVQNILLVKEIRFKRQLIIQLPSLLTGSLTGVIMALNGYGVWSIVWSGIVRSFVNTVMLWYYSSWKPSFDFNLQKWKLHFNYGYKLTLTELLNAVFVNIYPFIIGRYFTLTSVAFYTQADALKQVPVSNIYGAVNRVSYPVLCTVQSDEELKRIYKKLVQGVILLIAPVLIFMAVLAEPLIVFLLTDKWKGAVVILQILCVVGIVTPLSEYNLNILKVKGRSDLVLKLGVFNKVITVISIVATLKAGLVALVVGKLAGSLICYFINGAYSGLLIGYSVREQLFDILPGLLAAVFAGGFVFLTERLVFYYTDAALLRLLAGAVAGLAVYAGVCYCSNHTFRFYIDFLQKKIKTIRAI